MTKKTLPPLSEIDESRRSTELAVPVLGKQTLPVRTASAKKLGAPSSVEEKNEKEPKVGGVRGLLTKQESSGALRRGTPRPGELKKSLSTIKFAVSLDEIDEEDLDVV